MVYPDDPLHTELALAIQNQWARIGADVSLEAVPFDTLLTDYLTGGNYEAALVDLNLARSPDPDPYPFWHQAQINNGQNYAHWDDRPASEYLERARIIVELEERARLYRNFQVRFSRELPALPLFYPVYTYGVAEEVQGIRLGPLFDPSDRFLTVNDWYLLARVTLEDVATPTETN
jgi:peptide/nickel transport system substrate-binding protein